ncbi:ABC transporter permease [Patulibacter americanus]|uniref:ABC transporter permease n=1 Tax=Patulibacter americanus TaxID=588672 RepID=UPI0003B7B681|nr:ABC transporter permease [Patulibacter americanus]
MSTATLTPPARPSAAGRLLRRVWRQPLPVRIGGVLVGILVFAAVFAPLLAPYGQNDLDFNAQLQGPSLAHPMGTDDTGRDVFSRTLYGLRIDLAVVLFITYVPLPIGVLMGAIAGYFGGKVDLVISRIIDITIAFPFIVLVIAIVAIVGPGLTGIMIGVPIVAWALYARLARSEMLVLREQPFMLATTALGYTRRRAILRHAVPNLMRSSLIYSTVDLVVNLLLLAGLSYLGLGMQPPNAELGTIIAEGQANLLNAWWITTLPGLVLVVFGVGVGLIGDGLSDGELRGGGA